MSDSSAWAPSPPGRLTLSSPSSPVSSKALSTQPRCRWASSRLWPIPAWSERDAGPKRAVVMITSRDTSPRGHLPARVLPASCQEPACGLPAVPLLSVTRGAVQASWCQVCGVKNMGFLGLACESPAESKAGESGRQRSSCPALPCLRGQLQPGTSPPVSERFSLTRVSPEHGSCSGCPRSGPALGGLLPGWFLNLSPRQVKAQVEAVQTGSRMSPCPTDGHQRRN